MAKKIERYLAVDGELFDNLKDCERYELSLKVEHEDALRAWYINGDNELSVIDDKTGKFHSIPFTDMSNWVLEHGDVLTYFINKMK